jgi:flagellar motor switch protein FliN
MTLASCAKGLVEELSRALQAAAGRPAKAGPADVATLPPAGIGAKLGGKAAAFCLEFGGSLAGHAAVVLPGTVCTALAALLGGATGPDLAKRVKPEPSDEEVEILAGTLSSALVGMAEKLSAFAGSAPGIGLGDALTVGPDNVGEMLRLIGAGPYPVASFPLAIEGLAEGTGLIVFPVSFEAKPAPAPAASGAPPAPIEGGDALSRLHTNIQRILRLKLQVSVVVAEKPMDMESVIKLNPGTIVEFDKGSDEHLDLMVNGRKIAAGEVVIIGERFGIQLREVEGLRERIRKMGPAA